MKCCSDLSLVFFLSLTVLCLPSLSEGQGDGDLQAVCLDQGAEKPIGADGSERCYHTVSGHWRLMHCNIQEGGTFGS